MLARAVPENCPDRLRDRHVTLIYKIEVDVNLTWRNVVSGLESKCQQSSTMVELTIYACQIDPKSPNNVKFQAMFSWQLRFLSQEKTPLTS